MKLQYNVIKHFFFIFDQLNIQHSLTQRTKTKEKQWNVDFEHHCRVETDEIFYADNLPSSVLNQGRINVLTRLRAGLLTIAGRLRERFGTGRKRE